MYWKKALSLGTLLVATAGICNQDKAVSFDQKFSKNAQISMSQGRPVESTKTSKRSELTSMVDSHTNFGLKLFQEIIQQNPQTNTVVSPLSVGIALSMLFNGADGVTQKELASALDVMNLSIDEINQGNQLLRETLENSDSLVQIAIANSLWAKSGFPIQPSFLKTNQQYYDATVQDLDFTQSQSVNKINNWVAQNTQNQITEIVDSISPNQALFLINAIYFKGQWQNKFDPQQTTQEKFYLSNGNTVEHPMMSNARNYRYYENADLQLISLPYGSGNLEMNIFLPQKQFSLGQFFQQLNRQNLESWQQQMKIKEGILKMPRFTQEYEANLNPILQKLGASSIFDSTQANFQSLSDESIAVDSIKHKALIEVNEEGTEASATTSIGIVATSVETPFEMIVNRPFFYTIRDNQTKAILFMGIVENPQT